jgi:ABC-type transport system substrate-binding protein
VDAAFAKELPAKAPSAVMSKFNYPAGGWITFNVQKAPYNVTQVRQAFMMGIDRDAISSAVYGGVEPWALPAAFQGLFTQEETKALAKYDPEGAKRLLAQAGFAGGVDMEMEISGNSNPVAELIQAQLKKVGINIRLIPTDRAQYSSLRKAHKYNIQWITWACASQLDDQDTQLYGCYYSTSAYNDGGVQDPVLDKLILAQRAESDENKRRELHRDAVKRLTEMAWAGSLFYPTQYEAWHPALKNYAVHAASRTSQPWHEVWLEK